MSRSRVTGGERARLIHEAQRLYADFTGHHDEMDVQRVRVPDLPKALTVIGECDGILYTTVRDGEIEKYIHRFKSHAKPLFCVAPKDGAIFLVGGEYDFTERGIVDRPK